jgi:hypothetical protein
VQGVRQCWSRSLGQTDHREYFASTKRCHCYHTFMSEGKRSRCVKYEGRAVWKPAAVMERVARTAPRRNSTDLGQRVLVG